MKGEFYSAGLSMFRRMWMAHLLSKMGGGHQAFSGLLVTVPGYFRIWQKSVLSVSAAGMQCSSAALHVG